MFFVVAKLITWVRSLFEPASIEGDEAATECFSSQNLPEIGIGKNAQKVRFIWRFVKINKEVL